MSELSPEFRGPVGPPQDFRAESIGERLKRLRLERGLSQRDLSSPGVSYAYISRIEAGARSPSVKALRMLARKLGVSVEYLETGRDLGESEERELRLADAELELRIGEGARVAEKLAAILDEAVHAGDLFAAQRARVAMAMAAERRGDHLEVVERLEHVVHDATAPSPITRSEVYTMLGRAYAALGASDRAVRLFQSCLDDVTRDAPTDITAQVRYATFLSYALTDSGEYERAGEIVANALARAGDSADTFTRVRLYWSLARLQVLEGRSGEALENIRHAIALLEVTEDTLMLARAYLLAAGAALRKSDPDEAGGYLEVHFLPAHGWLSDSFTSAVHVSPLSWTAASLEVAAAVALAAVGLRVLQRRGGPESASRPYLAQRPVKEGLLHPLALLVIVSQLVTLIVSFVQAYG